MQANGIALGDRMAVSGIFKVDYFHVGESMESKNKDARRGNDF